MAGEASSVPNQLANESLEPPPDAAESVQAPPVVAREIVAIALWTLLADVLIFRAFGYSGPALFVAMTPILFLIGCPNLPRGPARKVTIGLLWLVAARLAWLGSSLTVFAGVILVVGLAMSAAGAVPYVLEGAIVAARALADGAARLASYRLPSQSRSDPQRNSLALLTWAIPIVVTLVFGGIFVLANPDLFAWVTDRFSLAADRVWLWFEGVSVWELPFCLFALLLGAGLMRPNLPIQRVGPEGDFVSVSESGNSPLYSAFRNTLLMLIVLFAAYLVFEFMTLWKREFPEGFYYAGYAHQGAAWLTYALALATALLSGIFSGRMLGDPRQGKVRMLAWIWSAENILLAAAVYNRLAIYVGYNGMTQMRTVGFFGITLVVIGFVLVLYKIAKGRSFWWLVRCQLLALIMTVIAYSVFPVDYVAHRFNARAIVAGYYHPSVMIAVKPISDEGYFPLIHLPECDDPIVRDGILAMLAERQVQLEEQSDDGWTDWQGSRHLLLDELKRNESKWYAFFDPVKRKFAIEKYQEHAMQWY